MIESMTSEQQQQDIRTRSILWLPVVHWIITSNCWHCYQDSHIWSEAKRKSEGKKKQWISFEYLYIIIGYILRRKPLISIYHKYVRLRDHYPQIEWAGEEEKKSSRERNKKMIITDRYVLNDSYRAPASVSTIAKFENVPKTEHDLLMHSRVC